MRRLILLIITVVVPYKSVFAQEPHRILEQDGAPVIVRKYEPEPWGTGFDPNDGVHHHFRFRNDSDRVVVAVKFGVLSYNVFNEFQEGTEAIVVRDVLPGKRTSYLLRTYHDDPGSFFTGLIYVAKVRFQDGGIWEADVDALDEQIMSFEAELRRGEIERRPGGG